jgi:hypothetical protein
VSGTPPTKQGKKPTNQDTEVPSSPEHRTPYIASTSPPTKPTLEAAAVAPQATTVASLPLGRPTNLHHHSTSTRGHRPGIHSMPPRSGASAAPGHATALMPQHAPPSLCSKHPPRNNPAPNRLRPGPQAAHLAAPPWETTTAAQPAPASSR